MHFVCATETNRDIFSPDVEIITGMQCATQAPARQLPTPTVPLRIYVETDIHCRGHSQQIT